MPIELPLESHFAEYLAMREQEKTSFGQINAFTKESNKIEGISGASTDEVHAHLRVLRLSRLTTRELERFVAVVQPNASLRREVGQNVVIVNKGKVVHRPVQGGPTVPRALTKLLRAINAGQLTPFEAHVEYETLHPFTDGNGRSGRVIWLWQMQRQEPQVDPFALPFLHLAYYQALQTSRRQESD